MEESSYLRTLPDEGINLKEETNRLHKHLIEKALSQSHGNRKHAAKLLNLRRTTMVMKMKRLGIKLNPRSGVRDE